MDSCTGSDAWREPRLIPCYAAAVSLLSLALWMGLRRRKSNQAGYYNVLLNEEPQSPWIAKVGRYVQNRGGGVLYAFHVLRFVGAAALVGLTITRLMIDIYRTNGDASIFSLDCQQQMDLHAVTSYLYAAALALATLFVGSRTAKTLGMHASTVLFIKFCVFAWRNLWPLMIFGGGPADADHAGLTWSEAALITLVGVVIPLVIPTSYEPINPEHPCDPPGEQTASLLGLNFFYFLEPFIIRAYRQKHLPYDALPPLADYDQSTTLEAQSRDLLDPIRRKELGLKDRHLFFGLMHFLGIRIFWQVLIVILNVIATFLGPIAINRLLRYLETGGRDAFVRPWTWILLIFVSRVLFSLGENGYLYVTNRTMVHSENILLQLVFAQSMRMRATSQPSSRDSSESNDGASANEQSVHADDESTKERDDSIANVNTLIGADIPAVLDGREFVFFFLQCPLEVIASVWFLTTVLGWAAVIGMIILVITLPLPGLMTKRISDVQKLQMEKTDQRVKTITESLNILRMIKMFAWETLVKERVDRDRQEELRYVRTRRLYELVVGHLNVLLPIMSMIVTYGAYTLVFHHELNASVVFSSMSIFDLLRMDLVSMTRDMSSMINVKVSLDRIDKFLRTAPLLDAFETEESEASIFPRDGLDHGDVIGFHNASFAWNPKADGRNSRNFRLNIEGDLIFKRGTLNLIVGATGCGKTSMLMALLGEMHFQPTGPYGWFSLPRDRGVAYAAQESWVMNETIKRNILFGSLYNEERYETVLRQCALEPDLALFAAGDGTEVGEKGITLSGGQKARITLARAIYSSAETLLLDDILSALDVHTSRWIVDKCLQGDLVKGRTIILVTHALPLVGPIAANVMVMDMKGRVVSQGPPDRILQEIEKLDPETKNGKEPEDGQKAHDALDEKPDISKANGAVVVEEERAEGRLKWAAVDLLLSAYGGFWFWVMLLSTVFLSMLTEVLSTWWLSIWTSAYEDQSGGVPTIYYLGIFILLAFSQSAWSCIASVGYITRGIQACQKVHSVLIESVMATTLRWIDTTPRGRIISRFTQDIRDVDGPLTQWLIMFIARSMMLILKFSAVMVKSPAMILPGLLVAVVGYGVGQVYLYCQMAVKRIRSNWRSPIYNHFTGAIAGLVSIRAYGAQDAFKMELFRRLDAYTRPFRTFQNVHRWIAARVDLLGALFATGVAIYLVYVKKDEDAGRTGFSLNMAIGFAGMILWWLRTANSMEVTANSLERIRDYIIIDHEPESEKSRQPPAYWPASGAMRVESLSATYSKDGPRVLQEVSFDVKSGERVGIVGRTGSGKSTLALSLLRLIPTTGEVYIDGLATSAMNLDALRGNITIIPQEPVLMSGTLRTNLDPFGQHDDALLNDAMRATGLLDGEERDWTLDTTVSDAGGNFSVGERQLIALARAIVRNSKLLILDEATASVDHATDNIIQESIRRELKGSTLITIAHRLRTIMDYDKIMVLDAGKLVEFDSPAALLEKEDGFFRSLIEESGDRDALWEVALQGRQ